MDYDPQHLLVWWAEDRSYGKMMAMTGWSKPRCRRTRKRLFIERGWFARDNRDLTRCAEAVLKGHGTAQDLI